MSVSVGPDSGFQEQGSSCIAIGNAAGFLSQSQNCIAIGSSAGGNAQGTGSIAIGDNAGSDTQHEYGISIGYQSGQLNQGTCAISLGSQSGSYNQGTYAVAIGYSAGYTGQGQYSIAIGNNAGYTGQADNTIAINATASTWTPATSNACYINPIRGAPDNNPSLVYNITTYEITYNTSSRKYKENIVDLKEDTSAILQVRPVDYTSRVNGKDYIGYIAEEVNDIDTHFSWKNADGEPEGIDWFNMLTYTITELQKLRKEFDELKQSIKP